MFILVQGGKTGKAWDGISCDKWGGLQNQHSLWDLLVDMWRRVYYWKAEHLWHIIYHAEIVKSVCWTDKLKLTCTSSYTGTQESGNFDKMRLGLAKHALVSGHQMLCTKAWVINYHLKTPCHLLLKSWDIGVESCSLNREKDFLPQQYLALLWVITSCIDLCISCICAALYSCRLPW